jgi:hypothetical protein
MEDVSAFQSELESWLREIVTTKKPAKELLAFRIGIDEVEEGYLLYLAGSVNYDEADDEWAAYPPEFIAEKELIIASDEQKEWYWMLLEVIYSLGRVLRKAPLQTSFLGYNTPVYTGFAGGDLYRIK